MELLPPITDRDDFVAWRRGGVGASDIAGLLGLSPWSSAWSIWATKVGLDESDEPSDAMQHGLWAEHSIARWYEERHDVHVDSFQVRAVGAEPWMRATLDGLVWDESGPSASVDPLAVFECKATADSPSKWAEGIPDMYACQATWQSIVTGIPTVVFAVLHVPFGRISFERYEYTPDDEDKALVLKTAAEFWQDHVIAGVPPEADGSDATTTAIRSAYGHLTDADDTLIADAALTAEVGMLRYWRAELAAAEGEVSALENRLKARMADCAALVTSDGRPLITWKPSTTHRLDTHALKADHPDLVEKYMTETVTRRFLVKKQEG